VVRTDHQALAWLFNLKHPSSKIARWIEILAPYGFAIEYRKGNCQGNADGLSRCEDPRDCDCDKVDMSEALNCGPCKTCRRRADLMQLATPHSENVDEKKASDSIITVEIAGDAEATRVATINDDQQPGTSSEAQIPVCATWTQGYDLQELSRVQREDDGIVSILGRR